MTFGSFQLLPAVDLLGGDAVRLERGDYERVTLRRSDPEALVAVLACAGAERIHIVDLDGARSGRLRAGLIARLVAAAAPALVQAAGGVRSTADAEALLEAGAERVVAGTAIWSRGGRLDEFVRALGDRLVVAVDARAGRVAMTGWLDDAGLAVEAAAERCALAGVTRLLCTAVERDGTLSGPDVDLAARVVERSGLPVLAAGGVRGQADLAALEAIGCEGAVVGRALLEALPR